MTASNQGYGERRRNDDEWRRRVDDLLLEHHNYFHGSANRKGLLWYMDTRMAVDEEHHRQNSAKLDKLVASNAKRSADSGEATAGWTKVQAIVAIAAALVAGGVLWMAVLSTISSMRKGEIELPSYYFSIDSDPAKVQSTNQSAPKSQAETQLARYY